MAILSFPLRPPRLCATLGWKLVTDSRNNTMSGNTMLVSTDKETVSRLMVAELMDLEIDFSFRSMARSGAGG